MRLILSYVTVSFLFMSPGRVTQSVARLSKTKTKKQRLRARYPVQPHTSVFPSADARRAVVSEWRKCVHEVLVNRIGDLRLPRKKCGRLTVRPDMTIAVYRGLKTTTLQQ